MWRAEHRLILTLLGLAVIGHAARLWFMAPHPPGAAFLAPGEVDDRVSHRARAVEEHRPLAPGEHLDPNTATAAQLARLPRIGMRLAKEIVADRELRGFFGSVAELDRVAGIGPATLRRLEPFLRFGRAVPAPPRTVDINRATQAELETLPGIGPVRAQAILAYRDKHGPFADQFALGRVPGIGRKLAAKLAAEGRLK